MLLHAFALTRASCSAFILNAGCSTTMAAAAPAGVAATTTGGGESGAEAEQPLPADPAEEERKRIYQLAVVSPLCGGGRQRRYGFVNRNGFVEDPVALFKAAKKQTFWNEREKEVFLDKLLLFGKNFEIIARFLEKKASFGIRYFG